MFLYVNNGQQPEPMNIRISDTLMPPNLVPLLPESMYMDLENIFNDVFLPDG